MSVSDPLTIFLMSLATAPVPIGPMCNTCLPILSRWGSARATRSPAPPTTKHNSPARTVAGTPVIHASTTDTDFACAAAAMLHGLRQDTAVKENQRSRGRFLQDALKTRHALHNILIRAYDDI